MHNTSTINSYGSKQGQVITKTKAKIKQKNVKATNSADKTTAAPRWSQQQQQWANTKNKYAAETQTHENI